MNMESRNIFSALAEAMEKNRIIRVSVIGGLIITAVLLFLLSGTANSCSRIGSAASVVTVTPSPRASDGGEASLERRLESILSGIRGVGQVRVMLTADVQGDKTALFGSAGADTGGIRGVIVVAEGAADISVRLSIIAAVSTVLGINESCVEVFVMAG